MTTTTADEHIVTTLLGRIGDRGVAADATINPFWRLQLVDARKLLDRTGTPSVAQLRGALGYNSAALPPRCEKNRDLEDWPAIERMMAGQIPHGVAPGTLEHAGG
jgi:hypothetical protein